jgi:hypothetical protein
MILAIDPGLSGAIAAMDESGLRGVRDMPTRPIPNASGKTRNEVDPKRLRDSLRDLVPADKTAIVVMESMHAFMGGGEERKGSMSSQASLAATKAVICTVCELSGFDVVFVTPRTWQRIYGIKATPSETTKQQSLRLARQLYGKDVCPLAKHDGRADAVLIARWAMRHNIDLPAVPVRIADPLDF